MKARLFLAYLRFRKLLEAIAIISILITAINQFPNYRHLFVNNDPWIVKDVRRGDRFTVIRNNKTLNIQLCGISAGDESQEYLQSLINKGDGSAIVNPVRKEDNLTVAEIFVSLRPDYEREIHLNTEMVTGGMAVLAYPDICPSAEYLKMVAAIKEQ